MLPIGLGGGSYKPAAVALTCGSRPANLEEEMVRVVSQVQPRAGATDQQLLDAIRARLLTLKPRFGICDVQIRRNYVIVDPYPEQQPRPSPVQQQRSNRVAGTLQPRPPDHTECVAKDSAPGNLRKAAAAGTLELVASPVQIHVGDAYKISVYVNAGAQPWRLHRVSAVTRLNRQEAPAVSVPLLTSQVPAATRRLVAEIPGTWVDALTWVLIVSVIVENGDSCSNSTSFRRSPQ